MDWFLYDNGLRHERVKDASSADDMGKKMMIWGIRLWEKELD